MSNYQPKPGIYHVTHPTNKVQWSNSSIPCTLYNDSNTNKLNPVKQNTLHQPINGQFSHNYRMYMATSGFSYNYSGHEDTTVAKDSVPNGKKRNACDNRETSITNIKKPRVMIIEKDVGVEETNTSEPKVSVAPQIASAISSHKNKHKSHLFSPSFKDYIRRQNDKVSRNASETYLNDGSLNPELFVNNDSEIPNFHSNEKIFSNVESSNYEEEEDSCDDTRESYLPKSLELQNIVVNADQEFSTAKVPEFLESDFSKVVTSEDFMTGTKNMYKNFVIQFQPVVDGLVDKAKSTKKEDRDSLAMDMWQLGCLENTIRNKVEKIDVAEKKLLSLLKSLEKRKFILNNIEKTIHEGKSKIYKAAEK
ncbi:Hypothetical protein SRAE_2000010800 [Strongyloides ratti]|uniref:Extracellular mutant protein 11 C-terminal domain-containing protein n=1 Tax=Strongyloides ratti TaxID=34506 RepID=A0A090LBC3_STRRB|nr:Hypothetical protein SRAE_2000010800 [Strongyloides ratti]CEF65428.1 Hypothetical protein SRAE_2000010800 [Strongyloides ratti]